MERIRSRNPIYTARAKDRPPGLIVLAAWQRAQAGGVVGRRRVGWLEATLGFPA